MTIDFEHYVINDFSVISPLLYKEIADYYGLVVRNTNSAGENVNNVLSYITQLDSIEAKLDLMQPIKDSTAEIASSLFTNLIPAVSAISRHLLERYGVDDINTYLSTYDILVMEEWATLCQTAGYPVDSENIES